MKKNYLAKIFVPILLLSGLNAGVTAQTTTFSYTGAMQSWTVPAGVSSLQIDAQGAAGGVIGPCCSITGLSYYGGRVVCTLAVTGGQVLNLFLGQKGPDGLAAGVSGGWNGGGNAGSRVGVYSGGGGGGATDIRIGGTALTDRKVVAGAAGGDGYNGINYCAGVGGGLVGGNGCNATGGGPFAYGGTQTAGGAQGSWPGYATATPGSLGLGGNNITDGGIGGGGGGGYYGGGAGVWGGGGGGSSYTDPVLVTGVTHTQGTNSGNGTLTITILCGAPGSIVGTPSTCIGGTTVLTNPTGATGGVWVSSDGSVATVGSSSGVVTGVAAGTATITYVLGTPCGGSNATRTVTINPLPSPLPAVSTLCQAGTLALTETVAGGNWTTSNSSIATVGSTGIISGAAPGTATISYTLPTGCAVSTLASVNTAPPAFNITGGGAYCTGGTGVTIGLSGSTAGFDYQLISGGTTVGDLTGTGAALNYGLYTATGAYTVLATDPGNGCTRNMTGSATITMNPLPAPITGTFSACVGGNTTLANATPGGLWTSGNPAQATVVIGTGVVTGVFAGVPTISYTIPSTGCRSTQTVTINTNPTAILGSSNVCVGSTTTLSDAVTGGTWTSSNTAAITIGSSSGVVTGVIPGASTIVYMLPTGCSISAVELSNALPSLYTVTGGGSYCAGSAGVHIGLSFSNIGINYQLLLGGTPVGSAVPGANTGIDFGLQTTPGTYTVVATNSATGCSATMAGSASVSLSASSNVYTLLGGGSYCSGTPAPVLSLDGSDIGIQYQVYNGGVASGGVHIGTGSPLSLGAFSSPGTYTVVAINTTTGCTVPMLGSTLINVYPLPAPYTVSGGGTYCAGGTGLPINLSSSDAGNYYVLYLGGSPSGISDTSIGGPITFGSVTAPGTYTVVAIDPTHGCTNNMSGSASIVVNPLPAAYTVTGGGGYCSGGAGVHVGLNFSTVGIQYQLWSGGAMVGGPVAGSGTGLDFGVISTIGVYTVTATNPSNTCTNLMNGSAVVSINLPPITFNMTGGGNFCFGSTGVNVGVNSSETGVNYQLYRSGSALGSPVAGTGTALTFGTFSASGTYTAVASSGAGCLTNMMGSAVITLNAPPTAYNVLGGGSFCSGDTGRHVTLNNSEAGASYELFLNGSTTFNVMPGTGAMLDFGNQTGAGIYTVVATSGAGCTRNMTGSANISVNPAPNVFNMIGGGAFCTGGTGAHVGLDGSTVGFSYQLYFGAPYSTTSGLVMPGSGGPIDFGLKTGGGSYTAVATNMLTGCQSIMNGASLVNVIPLPTDQVLTGGGSRCADGAGLSIDLLNSDAGVDYQLYRGSSPVGTPVAGSGGPLNLGVHDTAGIYTVVAKDQVTFCTRHMPGSVSIIVINPATFTVLGGGNFCSGGAGVPVNLSGSATSETYELYFGGVATGSILSGTGSSLSFGNQTVAGVYSVKATNISAGCLVGMTGTVNVVVNPLPTVNNVTGGGAYCAGGAGSHVYLSSSNTAIQYQLYRDGTSTGSPAMGTSTLMDFGPQSVTGVYKIKAYNPVTGCRSDMADSAIVTVKPLPVAYIVAIENYGNYCAADTGLHVSLPNSEGSVKYQLYRGAGPVGAPVTGNGSALDLGRQVVAGTYSIIGTDTVTGCSNNMLGTVLLNIVPLPAVHNVTGGGSFCRGGSGVHVGLDGSDPGMYYTLFDGPYSAGSLYGTGAPLDFGLQIATGNYRVIANSVITDCPNPMLGNATVLHDTLPTPHIVLEAFPGSGITVWHIDSIQAHVTNGGAMPTYQWYINGNKIFGATNESFTNQSFFNNDEIACDVTASGPCGGNTARATMLITLHNVGVSPVVSGNANLQLMPNPNKGSFTVKGNIGIASDEVSLEVVNMLGQVVYSGTGRTQNGTLEEHIQLNENVAKGMYLLNVRCAGQQSVFYFVVEK